MNFPEWVSAMSVREVLDVALSYFKVILSWPAVALIAVLIFRAPIARLIARVKSIEGYKVSFGEVNETVVNARAAAQQATTRLLEDASGVDSAVAEAQPSDAGDAQRAAKDDTDQATSSADAQPNRSNRRTQVPSGEHRDARKQTQYRSPFAEAMRKREREREQEQARMRHWMRFVSKEDPVELIDRAWKQLEETTLDTARTLGYPTPTAGGLVRYWSPAELFTALYLDGRGSREAVLAVQNATSVRNDMARGADIDLDEAHALADAIDELSDTARKLAQIKDGEKIVKSWLERHGDETLPRSEGPH